MMPTCAFKAAEVRPEGIPAVGEGGPPLGLGCRAVKVRCCHLGQVNNGGKPVREGGEVGGEVLDDGLVGLSKILQRDLDTVDNGRGARFGGEVEPALFREISLGGLGEIAEVGQVGKRRIQATGGGVNI